MKLQPQLRVDVEPFSEARWARVERELFSKLDREMLPQAPALRDASGVRRNLTWAVAAAAMAAAVMLAIFYPSRVSHLQDMRLATTDSTSQFTVGESGLTVAPRSVVMVTGDDDHGIDVVLDQGTVTCEVAPRHGRPPFRLDAGEVRVRVVGTKFTVTRADGGITVEVDHGAVEVTSRGIVTMLHDGERWPALAPSFVTPNVGPAPGDPDLGSSPSRTPTRLHHRHAPANAPASVDSAQPDVAPMETNEDASYADEPLPAPSGPTPQQQFEAAARRERTNPDEAAAAYRQLAASHTAWAQIALFALARLESDRGHRAEATRLFNAYLTRYPHGLNVDDARELLRRMR